MALDVKDWAQSEMDTARNAKQVQNTGIGTNL